MARAPARPRIFVGSSTESRRIAYAIQQNLVDDADVTVWDQNVFHLSKITLANLLARASETDFAIFVFSPDDVLRIRKQQFKVARDNVIFEVGLFMGRLGHDRTFILIPKGTANLKLPSDLMGVTVGRFNEHRGDGNLRAALGPFCQEIRDHLAIPPGRPAKKRTRKRPAPTGPLVIITALYGLRDHRVNVARRLNSYIKDGRLHVYVGNQLVGADPFPNSRKDLIVEYTFKGARGTAIVAEGDDLTLPPPFAQPLSQDAQAQAATAPSAAGAVTDT